MRIFPTLLPSLFLPLLTAASPAPPSSTPSVIPTGPTYHLKTVVVSEGSLSKDDLYVQSYHTGAGLNDVVLVPGNESHLSTGFLNGTYQEFDLGNEFPYGFVMGGDPNYAGWELVQMDAGCGDQGFYFNDSDGTGTKGLKWNPEYVDGQAPGPYDEFAGWLVCDWYHALPQLFWLANGEPDAAGPYPCSCAKVELHRVFL